MFSLPRGQKLGEEILAKRIGPKILETNGEARRTDMRFPRDRREKGRADFCHVIRDASHRRLKITLRREIFRPESRHLRGLIIRPAEQGHAVIKTKRKNDRLTDIHRCFIDSPRNEHSGRVVRRGSALTGCLFPGRALNGRSIAFHHIERQRLRLRGLPLRLKTDGRDREMSLFQRGQHIVIGDTGRCFAIDPSKILRTSCIVNLEIRQAGQLRLRQVRAAPRNGEGKDGLFVQGNLALRREPWKSGSRPRTAAQSEQ